MLLILVLVFNGVFFGSLIYLLLRPLAALYYLKNNYPYIHLDSQNGSKIKVNDKTVRVTGGLQRPLSLVRYILLLSFEISFVGLAIRPHIDHGYRKLPLVFHKSELELDLIAFDD
jgi:hypothetical protein